MAIRNIQTKEKDIVNACIQYLVLKGYEVIRNNTGAAVIESNGRKRLVRFGFPGSSDIIACSKDGRFVAVECKTEKGKLTEAQKAFLERIRKNNGIAIVARSVDDLVNAGV